MHQYGTWASYGGSGRILLAVVLLAAAGILAYAGTRFHRPVPLTRPGRAATVSRLLAWVLSIGTFLACDAYLVYQGRHHPAGKSAPADPITLVTMTAVVILFVVVFIATPRSPGVRLVSAVIAAMAAPLIFELPFDLIIMSRVYLPPADPAWYLALYFAPLVAVDLTTLSLLTLSPVVKLSRPAFFCLALMLLVFAAYALGGFGYPSAAFPIAMEDVAKVLAFVTALILFFPEWFPPRRRSEPGRPVEQAPRPGQPAVPVG
jgi:hypothetical protein